MKNIKKFDLKSVLTLISVISLDIFVAYVLFKIKIDKEIAMLLIGVFITLIQQIANYYFNHKDKDKE